MGLGWGVAVRDPPLESTTHLGNIQEEDPELEFEGGTRGHRLSLLVKKRGPYQRRIRFGSRNVGVGWGVAVRDPPLESTTHLGNIQEEDLYWVYEFGVGLRDFGLVVIASSFFCFHLGPIECALY